MNPPTDSAPVQPGGWNDTQARFYAETIAASDYALRVVPLLTGPWPDVLDVGAGSGALGSRLVADGGRWLAVEPQPAMQDLLEHLRPTLAKRRVELQVWPCTWQTMPPATRAAGLLAAHMGATHHQAASFFDAMAAHRTLSMRWVVAAQAGPSTFCLAGFLPAALHGADMQPAFERALGQLGPTRAPEQILFADWHCRFVFPDRPSAQAHFIDRMALVPGTPQADEVSGYVHRHARPTPSGRGIGYEIGCSKRSAVFCWGRR